MGKKLNTRKSYGVNQFRGPELSSQPDARDSYRVFIYESSGGGKALYIYRDRSEIVAPAKILSPVKKVMPDYSNSLLKYHVAISSLRINDRVAGSPTLSAY